MTRSLNAPPGFQPGGNLAREMRFETLASSYDESSRTVEAVFAAGSPVRRWGYVETLNMDPAAVDLSRVQAGQCKVLDSHNAFAIDAILGVVEEARIENGQLVGRVRFAETEAGRKAEGMVVRGELSGFSIGYSIKRWVLISEEETGEQTWRADDWSLLEVTLCAVPADPAATVRAAATSGTLPDRQQQEIDDMTRSAQPAAAAAAVENSNAPTPAATPTPTETRAAPETPASTPATAPAERSEAARATPAINAADIRGLQRLADLAGARRDVDGWIDEGLSRDSIFDRLGERAARRQEATAAITGPSAHVTRDEGDIVRRAVESALILRADPEAFPVNTAEGRESRELARNWRGCDSVLGMFSDYVSATQGVSLRHLSKMERATLALGLPDTGLMSRAGMSTSDFSNLMANVATKRLRDAYSAIPQAWRQLGRQSNSPDFKSKSVVALSSQPSFEKVVEGAEFKYGKFSDAGETYALATYGKIVPITRQALINDDLGAFNRLPSMMGRSAAELENQVVWGTFSANANMSDGVALFHANHANLGTAGDVTETTLAEAEQLMMEQLDAAGQPFNGLLPVYLIVTPKRKVAAQKLLTAVQATATSGVNTFANRLTLIVEARLKPAAGAQPWFVLGDYNVLDTFEYAYLDGQEGVYVEQRVGFEIDGLEIKGRLDFAAKWIDWRNAVKNAGN
ncbi:prohead protease/major capsid protein fusion protein [Methylocystis rosea]|uniref:prohead protease/major capsid protein fusion protein n=1 Tax=Methylocystis rosea TaxID=173366 RepID=UPI000380145B|nr:prohead protease/major capsid protein fusion protein [Methylocystis rosea]